MSSSRTMAAAIDKSLANEVKRELEWEPMVDAAAIGVDVKGGAVTLSGFVRSYSERRAAVRAAERVYGMQTVADEIDVRVSRFERDDDTSISQALQHRFESSIVIPKSVKAELRDGYVTLRGGVGSYHQRREAERAVRDVSGVKGVLNEIAVAPQVTTEEVEDSLFSALTRSAGLDGRTIWVTVDDGTVRLYGHVRSSHERLVAQSAAATAPGVVLVDNQITVTP
jgi:osmotically-inducible protein OsmY